MPEFRPISLITHPRYLEHDTGGGEHPEVAERLVRILKKLNQSPIQPYIHIIAPQSAKREWIIAGHSQDYLYRFEEAALSGRAYLDHPDNQICYDSYQIALLAAGAGPTAIDLVEATKGLSFCCVRPPGHHAERAVALGFCFLNNAVIAARYWQKKHNRQRLMIIDWDAHHGNGIQAAFEEDPDVFYISIHEHPSFSFPGTGYAEETGTGPGEGTIMNIPLLPGAGDDQVIHALHDKVGPALHDFNPEGIIVAAGFDGHHLDDMSGLNYSTNLYGHLGTFIQEAAYRYCEGRVIHLLEGGYHLQALAESVVAYLSALGQARQQEP